tara:strand:+ start:202 stop:744 length:543 start_codon:yes stop_codon:yes gene_type:complete
MQKMLYVLFFTMLTSLAFGSDPIVTESTTNSTITSSGSTTTTLKSPPPSAISPQFSAGNNSDLCTIGVAGAVQTQILGISAGTTFTEENCVRLKNAKTLYDMGMKVAAVSVMCQDINVFDAMMNAGTPCPYQGLIGDAARVGWESHVEETRKELIESDKPNVKETAALGGLGLLGWLLIF